MRKTRLFLMFVVASSCALAPGCVVDVRGTQRVELRVIMLATTQSVSNATVAIATQYGAVGDSSCFELTPEECLDDYAVGPSPGASSSDGTYVASSDVDGQVTLVVATRTECEPPTTCCPLKFCSNDPEDQVTGVDFYVRVEKDGSSEILTVEFAPGNTVSGEFFEVTVVSIGEPMPVEDSESNNP